MSCLSGGPLPENLGQTPEFDGPVLTTRGDRFAIGSQRRPVTYVVFDLLYERFTSLMHLPLWDRRRRLEKLVQAAGSPQWVFSQGVVGAGKAFFEEVSGQGLEGVVGKRLDSR